MAERSPPLFIRALIPLRELLCKWPNVTLITSQRHHLKILPCRGHSLNTLTWRGHKHSTHSSYYFLFKQLYFRLKIRTVNCFALIDSFSDTSPLFMYIQVSDLNLLPLIKNILLENIWISQLMVPFHDLQWQKSWISLLSMYSYLSLCHFNRKRFSTFRDACFNECLHG